MTKTLKFQGMKIGLCQQPCIPANPRYNGLYFEGRIEEAEAEELDLLLGVEGLQGYLIGDQYEYSDFLQEVDLMNENVRKSTEGKKVAVAYGSLRTTWNRQGEDGRVMRHNGGFAIQGGVLLSQGNKTLSPNYRMFPESRYFFSNRHLAEKIALETGRPLRDVLKELLQLVQFKRRDGRQYRMAQIFCEDGWPADYAINPLLLLSEKTEPGEEWCAVDHSASPWTWRKNNKRHRVIGNLIRSIPKDRRPKFLAYVNRVGMEQTNKNFYVYDGSSAVYDGEGDLIFEVEPYLKVTATFTFGRYNWPIKENVPDDTVALHDAMACAVDAFFESIPPEKRFVYIGLSGGIDSSVVAAFLVSRPSVGPDRVIGVNMLYQGHSSQETQDDASKLAQNLGIQYMVIPITEDVDLMAKKRNIQPGTLTHKNIQARMRMEVLAMLCQEPGKVNGLRKEGGLFTAQGNKVEMTFGFGTMYADIAGAIMILGDILKLDVYVLGEYLNRVVYGREVIPESVFKRPPADELAVDRSQDPFDYGYIERIQDNGSTQLVKHNGYHDAWARAVTEFRWDPKRFLEEYDAGTLERSFMLDEGHLRKLFPTAQSFVDRLEQDWGSFTGTYYKRMGSAPPLIVFSRRAFGGDLSESLYNFPPTTAYKKLRERILAVQDATTETLELARIQSGGVKS